MRHRCKWTENVTILVHRSLCHLHTNYFRYCGVNFSSESSDNHQLLWNVKGNLLFTRIWKLLMIFLGKSVSIRRVLRHTNTKPRSWRRLAANIWCTIWCYDNVTMTQATLWAKHIKGKKITSIMKLSMKGPKGFPKLLSTVPQWQRRQSRQWVRPGYVESRAQMSNVSSNNLPREK